MIGPVVGETVGPSYYVAGGDRWPGHYVVGQVPVIDGNRFVMGPVVGVTVGPGHYVVGRVPLVVDLGHYAIGRVPVVGVAVGLGHL